VCRRFVPRTHQNALCDPQIPPDSKHEFSATCRDVLFLETALGPLEREK
jgi:hypothetical protein